MNIILKEAKIYDPRSPFHLRQMDLLVHKGIITAIQENIDEQDETLTIKSPKLAISKGWTDMGVHYKEPGFEFLEPLFMLEKVAVKGGFTRVVGFPNTLPVVQDKSSLAFFKNYSQTSPVEFLNYASITQNAEGDDFTDLQDLHRNGAVGFSDGVNSLRNPDILLKTMQYLAPLGTVIVQKPQDYYLSLYGQMHEGIVSTSLGLKGIPTIAEEITLMRDIKLLEYLDIKSQKPLLHFSTISSQAGLRLVARAKSEGLPVSCDVSVHHLVWTDEDLKDFDTNKKISPPFRTEQDRQALIQGLKDGTIDAIVSDHNAWNSDYKDSEFGLAQFGLLGLEHAFSVLQSLVGLSVDLTIEKLVEGPDHVLGLKNESIDIGNSPNLTIFDPSLTQNVTVDSLSSYTQNTPYLEMKMKGKVLATIRNGKLSKNE